MTRLTRGTAGAVSILAAPILVVTLAGPLSAQTVAITGGTVYPVSGPPIENATVLIEDGRIVTVGPTAAVDFPAGTPTVDATGKVVTPGFIDAGTELGLIEVGSVSDTRDASLDDGQNRAAFRVSDGLNPRSMLFAIVRGEGITNAISAPTGGVVSGQAMALSLAGSTRAEVLARDGVAVYANLGPNAGDDVGGTRAGAVIELREALDEARGARDERVREGEEEAVRVRDGEPEPHEPDIAPLVRVLEGEIPLVIRASGTPDIEMALELQTEYGFRLAIDGGEEAWLLADRLAAAGVPVITRALENRPTQFDRLATRFESPGILAEAGVPVVLSTHDSHAAGQLPHEAGNAIRYGMSRDAALRAVTLEPARVFGLDDELGSLEEGKLANVVIWSGDPFDFSGFAERVFIAGREVDLDSRQRRLFERYRTIP